MNIREERRKILLDNTGWNVRLTTTSRERHPHSNFFSPSRLHFQSPHPFLSWTRGSSLYFPRDVFDGKYSGMETKYWRSGITPEKISNKYLPRERNRIANEDDRARILSERNSPLTWTQNRRNRDETNPFFDPASSKSHSFFPSLRFSFLSFSFFFFFFYFQSIH